MAAPKLRIPASGHGGSGYVLPPVQVDGKPLKAVGVTTALGSAGESGGLVQWAVNNTAAYAVANLEALYGKSEYQGYQMLRFYHTRAKESDFDDPEVDIHNYHSGVLNDAAELGTLTHEWLEAHLAGEFEPTLVREEQTEMIEAFLQWESEHDIEVILQEATVYGYIDGMPYAGTFDAILVIDGVTYLVDYKTSAAVRPSHIAQMAAYGMATGLMVECDPFTEGAQPHENKKTGEVSYWVEKPLPPFQKYGVLQVRPGTFDDSGTYKPAFVKFHEVSDDMIAAGLDFFKGAMYARHAETKLKKYLKGD